MNHHPKISDHNLAHEPWRHHFNTTGKSIIKKKEKLYLRLAVGACYEKPKGDTIHDDLKSNCFVKLLEEEIVNDLIFLSSGNTKWYFFSDNPMLVYDTGQLLRKNVQDAKMKKCCSDILLMRWIIMLEQKKNLFRDFHTAA